MTENEFKNDKLKNFLKGEVRRNLIAVGRRLVVEKGIDYLTARKLSEASGISVGTIYNLFSTMENFIAAENMQTLDELYALMKLIIPENNPFINMNRYVDVFSGFVIANPHLWSLLFREHLYNRNNKLSSSYIRKIKRIEDILDKQIAAMFGGLSKAEKRLSSQVLEMSLFALSGFLATPAWEGLRQVNKDNICKLLLNTYLAGLAGLKRVK